MPILIGEPLDILEKVWKHGYRGTFLGGCIERKEGSNIRSSAHVHCGNTDPFFGWVCIKSKKEGRVVRDGKATNLWKHELANLMSVKQGGYGKAFCKALVELGGRVFKYDHKSVKSNIGKVRRE